MNYKGAIAHGIMFHHFHGERHYKGQGSISGQDFEDVLRFVGLKRILDPTEWFKRVETGQLKDEDLCLTFDDGLLCQFEVALPILEKYGLKAFWFIYSSVFEGNPGSKFEIYRVFRSKFFENMEDFYSAFFKKVFESEFGNKARSVLNNADIQEFNRKFPFYTTNDIRFRFIRDRALNPAEFGMIIDSMIKDRGISPDELSKNLWMTNGDLAYLSSRGHNIGLHSYSHPTALADLSSEEQWNEFNKNYDHIKRVTANPPTAMAHPVGSYNEATLKILDKLGINCGFRSNMFSRRSGDNLNRGKYEIAREDHSNIMKMISPSAS